MWRPIHCWHVWCWQALYDFVVCCLSGVACVALCTDWCFCCLQSFFAVVDKAGFRSSKLKPVEFLVDRHLEFVEDGQLKPYKVSTFFYVHAFKISCFFLGFFTWLVLSGDKEWNVNDLFHQDMTLSTNTKLLASTKHCFLQVLHCLDMT